MKQIMVEPTRNRTVVEMVKDYQVLVNHLNNCGVIPKIHIMDNEKLEYFKHYIKKTR